MEQKIQDFLRCRPAIRSEEHTSELQSRFDLVCRLLLEKKKESITQRIWNDHSSLTLYCDPLVETTVRVRSPPAAVPSVCKPPEHPLTSYFQVSRRAAAL